ncbi:protein phosphatase 2C domain-containing protein [Streptosporangium subroseum]|uniref:protein phosphatase 2C domain-containing protein n=1 Tax=Streptosporangium subroseum TaxID=106412 RepID=UPI00308C5075|nr:protein phosphatase 2C domain-containing protein [Streptosporangium subroseum]
MGPPGRVRTSAVSALVAALVIGFAVAGCGGSGESGRQIVVNTRGGEREQLVAEIYAAALDRAGVDGVAKKVAEIADYAKQPDDARVAVDYDLDVLVAASPVPSTPDDQRLPTALPGHTLVSKTAIQSRAVLAVSPSLQQDIRTIAEFAQKYQNNAAGVTVLVPPEFGVFNRALTDRGLAVSDQADQAAFDAALTQPGFTGGAIVPAGSKQGNLVSLEDPDNILPSRTLSVFAGDQVAKGDPEAERVLQEVTDALTPQVVDRLLTEVKNNGKKPADVARDWAGDNVPTSSGFPLAQMILALLLGGAAAFTALYLFGWRPPTTAVRGGRRSDVATPDAPRSAAPQDTRVVVGPEPRRIAVHLPWSTTSADAGLALDGGLVKGTTVRAATVRGRTHSFRGETRQDAYGVRLSSDERWVIAVVADGLGSARHAEIASTVAVRAALDGIDSALRSGERPQSWDWKSVLAYVSDTVRRTTESLGSPRPGTNTERAPSARPGTTLTVAVLPSEGEGQAVCAAVGDSPAILVTGGQWQALTGEGGGGDNVTAAIPGDLADIQVQVFSWRAGDLLVLSSDGFAAGVAGGRTPLTQRLSQTWRTPPSLVDFVQEVDFRLSTFDDDRTVVAIWAGRHDTAVP